MYTTCKKKNVIDLRCTYTNLEMYSIHTAMKYYGFVKPETA